MTRTAKIICFGALLSGLSIGAFISFRTTTLTLEDFYDAGRLTAPSVLRDFSFLQYQNADPAHAKAALLTYASFLEEMQKVNPEKSQKSDLAATYVRLASVEGAAKNPELSQIYMAKAHSWYRSFGGRDLTDFEMKAAVDKMDTLLHTVDKGDYQLQ
jgi:hypothetical protein